MTVSGLGVLEERDLAQRWVGRWGKEVKMRELVTETKVGLYSATSQHSC